MRQAIGVDVGGTKIICARVLQAGAIVAQRQEPSAPTANAVLAQVDAMIAALDHPSVEAIGIGVPSRVNVRTEEIYDGGFVNLCGPPLSGRLKSPGKRPVFTDNDGTMALLAEARVGAARGVGDVAMLTIGTGIGGAVMLNGKVLHGKATAGQ